MEPDYGYVQYPQPAATYPSPLPRTRSRLPVLLLLLALLVGLWFLPTYMERITYSRTIGHVRALREEMPNFQFKQASQAFALVAEMVGPSVVHIDVRSGINYRGMQLEGQGSGVIVDTDGYIVTNNHVIENAQTATVNLSDGRRFNAVRVGSDPQNDLAVLKINADGLVAAPWGDSDDLKVGEFVWAVGNPFGLDRSITFGIISAKERRGVTNNPEQEFLQTDAAINPGNSGGPLVDIDGKIIGINTAIIGPSFAGVGFAIPSSVAKAKYEHIIANGSSIAEQPSGFIGVGLADVTPQVARQYDLPVDHGALIVNVMPDGPADRAGLEPGDIIVRWGDKEVQNRASLMLLVSRSPVGSTVLVGIVRDGREMVIEVEVGDRRESVMDQVPR